jgi:hypothetical protein
MYIYPEVDSNRTVAPGQHTSRHINSFECGLKRNRTVTELNINSEKCTPNNEINQSRH